jgi:peptidoglycan-associated lipoprotein
MSAILKVIGSVAVLALVGCSHEQPPPETPAGSAELTTTPAPEAKGADPAVNLSDDIMTQCKVKISNEPPKFDFDSSNLTSQERDILSQVAKCLTTGPLAGRKVQLTGRADPRGEQEYNMNLGEHRATSVRKYLVGLGVPDDHMKETSRGALDATGTDEAGWRNDRRVDVSLQ